MNSCAFALPCVALLLAACTTQPDPAIQASTAPPAAALVARPDSVAGPAQPGPAPQPEAASASEDSAYTESEYETVYVVIADTSQQYRPLQRQLQSLQASTGQRIDSMGRFYDPQKNLIRLPDHAPVGEEKTFDEMYAGDYYPRRLGDSTLSVEYTILYTPAREKSMALVAGIFLQPRPADSLLAVVRRTAPKAFRVKSSLFMGCLH